MGAKVDLVAGEIRGDIARIFALLSSQHTATPATTTTSATVAPAASGRDVSSASCARSLSNEDQSPPTAPQISPPHPMLERIRKVGADLRTDPAAVADGQPGRDSSGKPPLPSARLAGPERAGPSFDALIDRIRFGQQSQLDLPAHALGGSSGRVMQFKGSSPRGRGGNNRA